MNSYSQMQAGFLENPIKIQFLQDIMPYQEAPQHFHNLVQAEGEGFFNNTDYFPLNFLVLGLLVAAAISVVVVFGTIVYWLVLPFIFPVLIIYYLIDPPCDEFKDNVIGFFWPFYLRNDCGNGDGTGIFGLGG